MAGVARVAGAPRRRMDLACPVHQLPIVEVRYKNLTYNVQRPTLAELSTPPSLPHKLKHQAMAAWKKLRRLPADKETLAALDKITGVLRPGTSTLLLAAPGAGTSTFLRLIAGRLRPVEESQLLYNGMTARELRQSGVNLNRLAAFCPEYDEHEPLLTVKETFEFVHGAATVHAKDVTNAAPQQPRDNQAVCTCDGWGRPPTADEMIRLLGLGEAESTYVGNNMIRGVSGGQRRRVTVGESLLLNSRVLALDSITSGLDAATAHDVIRYVTTWTRKTQGTTIAALQQPTPEVLQCFDEIILLADGMELYHGPVNYLETYLNSLGFVRPSYMDLADFGSEVVADPLRAMMLSMEDRGTILTAQVMANSPLSTDAMAAVWRKRMHLEPMFDVSPTSPEVDGSAGAEIAHTSSPPALAATAAAASIRSPAESAHTLAGVPKHYSLACRPPLWKQTKMCFDRQIKLILRNRALVIVRCVNSIIMALILGSLAFDAPPESYQLRFGLALFASLFIAFTNNAEVPATLQSRAIAYKQTDAGLYNEVAYVWCVVLASLPLAIVADSLFGTILYFMTGWDVDVSRWAFFLLVLFFADVVMAGFLRGIMYAFPTQEIASAIGMGILSIWILFSGFFVIVSQLPVWLEWIAYTSPFRWIVTALTNNEFSADRYAVPAGTSGSTLGELFMEQFDFPFSSAAMWGSIIFLVCVWALIAWVLSPLALYARRYDIRPGTVRGRTALPSGTESAAMAMDTVASSLGATLTVPASELGERALERADDAGYRADDITTRGGREQRVAAGVGWADGDGGATSNHVAADASSESVPGATDSAHGQHQSVAHSAIAGVPAPPGSMTKVQSDITSARSSLKAIAAMGALPFPPVCLAFKDLVYTITTRAGERRPLLRGVSGWATPGCLTALMGASGAGKTTLLDVIAFRKTTGTVEGQVTLNGLKADGATMARVSGYCEQVDIHLPTATVLEAVAFSARLRMERVGTYEDRVRFVMSVLRVLELSTLANRIVGTLSRGEMKRLTIAVELASLPSLLFVDEPTTGLDSRSAAVVMRVLRRVAQTGRTVIATIHQPSAALFFEFDNLLLLAPGGYQVYFGRLGHHAQCLVQYLEAVDARMPRLPAATNPASWMLENVGGGVLDAPVVHRPQPDASAGPAVQAVPPAVEGVPTPATGDHSTIVVATANTMMQLGSSALIGTAAEALGSVNSFRGTRRSSPGGHNTNATDASQLPAPTHGAETAVATGPSAGPEAELHHPTSPSVAALPISVFAKGYARSDLRKQNETVLAALLTGKAPDASVYGGVESRQRAETNLTQEGAPQEGGPGDVVSVTSPGRQQPAAAEPRTAARPECATLADVGPGPLPPLKFERPTAKPFGTQLRYVYGRAVQDYWRNDEMNEVRLAVITFLAVLFGLIFLELDPNTFQGTQSTLGFILGGVVFGTTLFFSTGITSQFERREVFYRERASRYYSAEAYSISAFLVEAPYVAVLQLLFVTIIYWMVGLRPSAGSFFFFYLGALIMGAFFTAISVAYAALMPVLPIAQIVGGLTISVSFLFAGLFIPRPGIPVGWVGLYYADQFFCDSSVQTCPTITTITPSGPVSVDRYQFVADFLQSTYQDRWAEIGWAALAVVVMMLIAMVSFRFVNHQKR